MIFRTGDSPLSVLHSAVPCVTSDTGGSMGPILKLDGEIVLGKGRYEK